MAALPLWCEQEHRVAWEDKWTRIHKARVDADQGKPLHGRDQLWLDSKGRSHRLGRGVHHGDDDGRALLSGMALEAWGRLRWEDDRASSGTADCIHGPADLAAQRQRYIEARAAREDTDWLIEREIRTKEILQQQL